MTDNRVTAHPVLDIPEKEVVFFYWNKSKLSGKKNEMISSALFANNIKIFGHHPKDGSAQGIFCANGQCAKCTVIANGIPVKACMTGVKENMIIESVEGLPKLPDVDENPYISNIEHISTDVLIIGGGNMGIIEGQNKKAIGGIRATQDSANFYFYQNNEGQVIFCLTPRHLMKGTASEATSVFLPQVAKRMVALFPKLANLKVRRTWRGQYPMTPNGFPIVGETKEFPNFINAIGMCGQGYMIGPGLGELLTKIVTCKVTQDDIDILKYFNIEPLAERKNNSFII